MRRSKEKPELQPFDADQADAYVHQRRREGATYERILTDIRKHMEPPTRPRRWARAGEWHGLDIVDYATCSWKEIV